MFTEGVLVEPYLHNPDTKDQIINNRGSERFLRKTLSTSGLKVVLALSLFLTSLTACGIKKPFIEPTPTAEPTSAATKVGKYPPVSELVHPPQQRTIANYLGNYLENDWGARSIERFKKDYGVTIAYYDVQIHVTDKEGIWIRDFPDKKISRQIPTNGPATGAQYKALSPNQIAPGTYKYFVAVGNLAYGKTEELSIWTAYWSEEGGWLNRGQPHFETFPVYENGKWLVDFTIEESGTYNKNVPGEKVFGSFFPSEQSD